MVAVKNWFMEKNNLTWLRGRELKVIKETNKAVLVECWVEHNKYEEWVPKSCIIEEWEKDTSNFGYHDYLVETMNNAYRNGTLENKTFTSGRNRYDQTSFTHQMTTKELKEALKKLDVEFMDRESWNNR